MTKQIMWDERWASSESGFTQTSQVEVSLPWWAGEWRGGVGWWRQLGVKEQKSDSDYPSREALRNKVLVESFLWTLNTKVLYLLCEGSSVDWIGCRLLAEARSGRPFYFPYQRKLCSDAGCNCAEWKRDMFVFFPQSKRPNIQDATVWISSILYVDIMMVKKNSASFYSFIIIIKEMNEVDNKTLWAGFAKSLPVTAGICVYIISTQLTEALLQYISLR